MRAISLMLLSLPMAIGAVEVQGFGICRPVIERTSEIGCWILTDHPVGRISQRDMYWHLDSYADGTEAQRVCFLVSQDYRLQPL